MVVYERPTKKGAAWISGDGMRALTDNLNGRRFHDTSPASVREANDPMIDQKNDIVCAFYFFTCDPDGASKTAGGGHLDPSSTLLVSENHVSRVMNAIRVEKTGCHLRWIQPKGFITSIDQL